MEVQTQKIMALAKETHKENLALARHNEILIQLLQIKLAVNQGLIKKGKPEAE